MTTFKVEALPILPQYKILWPISDNRLKALLKVFFLPDTKIEIFPDSALCWPPVTGASKVSIFLKEGSPILLEYKIDNLSGVIKFYIAPKSIE